MKCPSCGRFVAPGARRCPACRASFGGPTPQQRGASEAARAGARAAAAAALVNRATRGASQRGAAPQQPAAHVHAGPATAHPGAACPPAASMHPQVLPEGTLLAGDRYFLGPALGCGSFGITYRAVDQRLGRIVAIKEFFPEGSFRQGGSIVPPPSLGRDGYESERGHFIQEARLLARFQRPGIVTVHEVFEQNDTAYMVMEYINGRTLVEVLKERGGPLKPAETLRYALAVADALAAVHEQHLLHRDVKPGNIMITQADEAVLIDFGAARAFDRYQRTSMMTAIGTPGYAPLEQWGSSGRFGPTSDVYALAATLYHLLTGRMPPSAADRAVSDTLEPPAKLNPAVSEALSDAVVKGLAVRMEDRPQTMAAFAQLLRESRRAPKRQSTQPPAAPPPSSAARSQDRAQPKPALPAASTSAPVAVPAAAPPAQRPARPEAVKADPQPAHQPVAAAPNAPKRRWRLFPWPRRRRDHVLWAGGVVGVPLVLTSSIVALTVLVPVLGLASVTFSGGAGRAARAGLRSALWFGLQGIGVCVVSVGSLAVVGLLSMRMALTAAASAHQRP